MNRDKLNEHLSILRMTPGFGVAGIEAIQPNIDLLTEEDIIKACEIVEDVVGRINFEAELKTDDLFQKVLKEGDVLWHTMEDTEQEEYFDKVYKHFNLEK